MVTLLLLLCGILTIISLCITLYGISHGEIKPIAIGGTMAFITLSLLIILSLLK